MMLLDVGESPDKNKIDPTLACFLQTVTPYNQRCYRGLDHDRMVVGFTTTPLKL